MEPHQILTSIIESTPKSIYGLIAKNCIDDKMMQLQFFAELYDDLVTDIDSFTDIFGFEVAQSVAKIVRLN